VQLVLKVMMVLKDIQDPLVRKVLLAKHLIQVQQVYKVHKV
jgi:hypothetical protein